MLMTHCADGENSLTDGVTAISIVEIDDPIIKFTPLKQSLVK